MNSTMEAGASPSKSHKHKNKTKNRKTTQTLNAIVTSVTEQPETKNPPVLGYSPSGFDPLTRKNVDSDELKFYRNQVKNKSKRVQFVVKRNGLGVDYVGSNYSGEAATGTMNGYALAVVKRSTQQFTVVPITSSKILRLIPLARASPVSDEPDSPAKIDTAEEKRLKTDNLTSLYGTKTAKKKDIKARRLYSKEDPSSLAELNQVIGNTEVDKSVLTTPGSNISRDVPPHDLSADTPEKAYLLDKIILKGEWDYLNDVFELLQAGKEIQSDVYPSFVCNRFYKLELLQDYEEKRRLSGILSYISHLINFKNRNSLDGKSASKHTKFIPGILSQKFTMMFIDPDKSRLADDKIPSLIGYVLVLSLFVDEFVTDFTDIASDLKMQPLALRPYFLNLGCRFKSRNSATVAELTAPLKFPTMRRRKRRE